MSATRHVRLLPLITLTFYVGCGGRGPGQSTSPVDSAAQAPAAEATHAPSAEPITAASHSVRPVITADATGTDRVPEPVVAASKSEKTSGVNAPVPAIGPEVATTIPGGSAPVPLIMPSDDEGPLDAPGPALFGLPISVAGKTYCSQQDLKLSQSAQLAIQTTDNTVYVVDDADTKFHSLFERRTEHLEVRALGTPYLKSGVMHLSATELKTTR